MAIDLLNTEELIERLGISKSSILLWRKKYGLPTIIVGRTVRYDWDAICEWLKDHETVEA